MGAWAVRSEFIDLKASTFAMESQRRPSIRVGDQVLVFERTSDDDVRFTHTASIAAASTSGESDESQVFKATLADPVPFDPPRELGDFTYSLQKVYRFEAPGRHFRNRYTSLTDKDYKTLVKANIFWARTAFGFFLSPLPEETREQFIRYVALVEPGSLVESRGYAALWVHLQNFIVQQFVSAHELLQAISRDVEGLSEKEVQIKFAEIRVGDVDDDARETIVASPDRLEQQTFQLADFVGRVSSENDSETDLFESIKGRIAEGGEVEATFEVTFRGEPWPMSKTQR